MKSELVIKLILSVALIGLGVKIIIVKKFVGRGGSFDFSSPFVHWPLGLVLILIGGLLLYSLTHFHRPR